MTELPLEPVDDGSALRKRRRQVIQALQVACVVTVSAGYLVCFADVRGSPFRHPLVHAVHVVMLWASLRAASKATPESAGWLVAMLFWFSTLLVFPLIAPARGHVSLHPTAVRIWWAGVFSTWVLMLCLFVVSLLWRDRETYAKELAYPPGQAHRFVRPWLALPLFVGFVVAGLSLIRSGAPALPQALPNLVVSAVGVLLFLKGGTRSLLVGIPAWIVFGADRLTTGGTGYAWSSLALAVLIWIYAGVGIHGITRVRRPT